MVHKCVCCVEMFLVLVLSPLNSLQINPILKKQSRILKPRGQTKSPPGPYPREETCLSIETLPSQSSQQCTSPGDVISWCHMLTWQREQYLFFGGEPAYPEPDKGIVRYFSVHKKLNRNICQWRQWFPDIRPDAAVSHVLLSAQGTKNITWLKRGGGAKNNINVFDNASKNNKVEKQVQSHQAEPEDKATSFIAISILSPCEWNEHVAQTFSK